jgi:hypothetical protein
MDGEGNNNALLCFALLCSTGNRRRFAADEE